MPFACSPFVCSPVVVMPASAEAEGEHEAEPVAIKMQEERGHKIAKIKDLARVRAFLESIPLAEHDLCTKLRLGAIRCFAMEE